MAIDFFTTAMGRRFYEHTVPKIADELARLNTNVAALVTELARLNHGAHEAPSGTVPLVSRGANREQPR